jgi:hypothetical protein
LDTTQDYNTKEIMVNFEPNSNWKHHEKDHKTNIEVLITQYVSILCNNTTHLVMCEAFYSDIENTYNN